MAVTTVATLAQGTTPEKIQAAYLEYYNDTPFIGLKESYVPQTGEVWGTNRCDIGWRCEGESLLLFSVIDNLVKGASGQAIQNMNIRLGFPETAGLPHFSEV
jgi:N-acetyl-gamma-glutamyl-phosphate reductase